MSDRPNVLIPAGTEITIQKAFDFLYSDIDEIRADIEQVRIYANKQSEMINDYAKQFILYKQAHNAAAQIMFADDPEYEKRVRQSVEIFTRIVDADTADAGNPLIPKGKPNEKRKLRDFTARLWNGMRAVKINASL